MQRGQQLTREHDAHDLTDRIGREHAADSEPVSDLERHGSLADTGRSAEQQQQGPIRFLLVAPDQVEKNIVALEKEMFSLAKDLEFEAAAQIRDRIEQLREQFVRN